jgi:shikimate kinase
LTNDQYLIVSYFVCAALSLVVGVLVYLCLWRSFAGVADAAPGRRLPSMLKRLFPYGVVFPALLGFLSVSYKSCSRTTYTEIVENRDYLVAKNHEQIAAILFYILVAVLLWNVVALLLLRSARFRMSGSSPIDQPVVSSPPTDLPRRIVLTGFMGSGKSTVGPLLASRLGWKFVDADDMIEAEAGVSIAELFTRHGEGAFREREHAAIARLASGEGLVMALGGGAIEHEKTRRLLLNAPGTLMVHLEVELATALARCRGTEELRPILADQANLAARYARRVPLYRMAHVSIAVDALTPEQAAEAIVRAARLG